MAGNGSEWWRSRLIGMVALLVMASMYVVIKESSEHKVSSYKVTEEVETHFVMKVSDSPGHHNKSSHPYVHVWPKMKFGWKIVVGAIIGFFGAAFGSVGGVGGGGIFVPMLTLIIGFDQKSSTALSKFMSTKAFLKGVETWKKETITKKEAAQRLQSNGIGSADVELRPLPEGQSNDAHTETKDSKKSEVQVSILENIYWKELGIIVAVWVVVLALQIAKNYTTTCSVPYWILNLLQIPVTVGATSYEAVGLYKGGRVIASRGEAGTNLRVHQLFLYCVCGIVAGIIGGLLGLGGGFILGPLFLELGIPPQVSSATATFAMAFSSSMSVVEYYLLKRFPHPYALYFFAVAIIAALVGQYVVTKVIAMIGRASLIIFILAVTIFISAILLGGVGIDRMIKKIEHKDHLGFYSLCK